MTKSFRLEKIISSLIVTLALFVIVHDNARAQTATFVPPPRTIADITAILDQEKPDPKVAARMRAEADAKLPANAGRGELARFHYKRCIARSALGEFREAVGDCEQAVQYGEGSVDLLELGRIRQGLAIQYSSSGDPKKALQVQLKSAQLFNVKGVKGFLFNTQRQIADRYIQLGDINQAEAYVRKNQSWIQEARGWPKYNGFRRPSWECDVEQSKAHLYEARGQFREAEASYRRTEILRRDSLRLVDTYEGLPPPPDQLQQSIDFAIAAQGRMKARQGRLVEGEADVRRALLSRLKATGKYNNSTAQYVGFLASLLVEQGRFAEAEQLVRRQIEIQDTLGVVKDAQNRANALGALASILNLQERWADAGKIYAELDAATKNWEPSRRDAVELNPAYIFTLYNTNNLAAGVAAAERLFAREKARFGERHLDTALTRGLLAIGYARTGRNADALREFKIAIPILMARSRQTDEDVSANAAAREQQARLVAESYMILLARVGSEAGPDAAVETFRLVDTIRGQSVQRALAASSARTVAQDPALAGLVRKEQDLSKQVEAQFGLLNNMLTLSPEERDDKAVKALQAEIDRLRNSRDAARREIAIRFRNYSGLVEPQSPTVDEIKGVLKPDEAFLSFYFGRRSSFVWAVPKTGSVMFAMIAESTGEIDKKIETLRGALEPNAALVSEIPPFNVALAYELYTLLLKPVEAGWKPAKNLIVVTNGALGLLPLSLLPTAQAQESDGNGPLFSGYRAVPWLARTHAVTVVPSAAALRTLRQIPPGSNKREPMIGFGDPIFSKAQAAHAAELNEEAATLVAMATTRGLPLKRRSSPKLAGVDSAELALLPALPDTADELKSIALALEADPAKVLQLGMKANEQTVKTTDLSRYKIIVFATHGLVPGDLNGLTQPALALTAPDVAGVDGDGLLTMEEILALKLDADWVVLSACNTGTGAGAGAEAASGLGRAFFYAGTRALLVTNWSVHSQSARDLTTDLFRRQTADPKLTRGEALRQAMMALLDGKGFTDDKGKTAFAYSHPLFWAPYTIIGDGG